MVVLNVAIHFYHPTKEKGSGDILNMSDSDIRRRISQYYVVVVTDCVSVLDTIQPFHTPAETKIEGNTWVHCFEEQRGRYECKKISL